MIKSWKPLIRLSKMTLDEKRQKLGALQAQETQLLGQVRAIEEEIVREQEIARTYAVEVGYVYPAFAASAFARRDAILEQVEVVRRRIELARIEVSGAHMEMRKYEKAEEMRLKKLKEAREKLEAQQLDELGLVMHDWRQREAQRFEAELAERDGAAGVASKLAAGKQ